MYIVYIHILLYMSSVYAQSHSPVRLFATLWTIACQAPLSMGFPTREYWSGLPFLPPGDLPDSGIKFASLCLLHWQANYFPLSHLGSPTICQPAIMMTRLTDACKATRFEVTIHFRIFHQSWAMSEPYEPKEVYHITFRHISMVYEWD